MEISRLSTYLNDHLLGSNAATDLLDSLLERDNGPELSKVLSKLRAEFEEERKILQQVMERLEISPSVLKRTTGWLNGKVLELKLALQDRSKGEFYLFEGLEVLSVGIAGKRLLWRMLDSIRAEGGRLPDFPYRRLASQAARQRKQIEDYRRIAGQSAFLESASPNEQKNAAS